MFNVSNSFIKKALTICIGFLFAVQLFSFSQKKKKEEMASGYYVVVGAYSANMEHYAKRYVTTINKTGKEADYGFNSKKNLYLVYLDYSQNYKAAISEMQSTRENQQFSDAWVFVCSGGESVAMSEEERQRSEEATKAMNKEVSELDDLYAEKFEQPEKDKSGDLPDENGENVEKEIEGVSEGIAEGGDNTAKVKTGTLQDYRVMFQLANARNRKEVKGEVQIIDTERAKLLTVVPSDEYVALPDPDNGTGKLTLICDVFGFRKNQRNINYYHPLEDTSSSEINVMSDIYVMNLDLVRYHVGDIVVMYNVYYFNDAAIMMPESKYEVNSLVEMMEENPDYKIRIHGHTNGKRPGKIIARGDSDSFFALSESNKQGFGSSKELSKERAEIIKAYLVDKGISADRMEIKAWGGRRMLYDKFSTKAKHNVRVEIEIIEE